MKKSIFFLLVMTFFLSKSYGVERHVYLGSSIQDKINISSSGDKIVIHGGVYTQSITLVNKTGITITAAANEEVVLTGDGNSVHTIYIENGNNITISNLTIKNQRKQAWSSGITIIGYGSGFNIISNKITDISYINKPWDPTDNPGNNIIGANAIAVIGNNTNTPLEKISIINNEVSYCITGWNEGVALKGNITDFNIEKNRVHHITNIGIDILGLSTYPNLTINNQPNNGTIKENTVYNCVCNYTDNGAIYADGANNILISNNTVYNNKFGIAIGCENQINKANATVSGIHVRNNLIHNNALAGILIGSNGVNNGSIEGKVIYSTVTGNTLIKNSFSSQWGSEMVFQNANNINCYNNLVYGDFKQMFTFAIGTANLNFRANRYFNTKNSFNASIQTGASNWTSIDLTTFKNLTSDAGSDQSTFGDPLIVNADPINPDPHLLPNSPCINKGMTAFQVFPSEKDIDGQARINGPKIDIGVDESGVDNICTPVAIDGNLSDWSSINPLTTAINQSASNLKVYNSSTTLFISVVGSNMDNEQYQIFINTDNNKNTGYQDNLYNTSGADYLIENGVLYKYNGGGWSWLAVSATIVYFKNSSILELSINRSAFTSINNIVSVSFKDMSNWVTKSMLPVNDSYSSYTFNTCQ